MFLIALSLGSSNSLGYLLYEIFVAITAIEQLLRDRRKNPQITRGEQKALALQNKSCCTRDSVHSALMATYHALKQCVWAVNS